MAVTLRYVNEHRSGRKSLVPGSTASYVGRMDLPEGLALLTRLRDHATLPQCVDPHVWSVGDMVIRDNNGPMHRAMHCALDSGRMMHRTRLEDEESFS